MINYTLQYTHNDTIFGYGVGYTYDTQHTLIQLCKVNDQGIETCVRVPFTDEEIEDGRSSSAP